MSRRIDRRELVIEGTAAGLAAAAPRAVFGRGPTLIAPQSIKPVVIASSNGLLSKDGDSMTCVARAFKMMTEGEDVLDSLIAGVNIVELVPLEPLLEGTAT